MNFNAYGYGPPEDRKWIVVDCGVLFGRETKEPGVDLIMPDIRFLAEQKENVLGIVATHAHEDHIGAIPHLWPMLKCPIYATHFTAFLIEGKLEEAGLSGRVHPHHVALGGRFTLGPFDIELISITHSIPEPNALAIRTPLGTICHTGDWKIDPEPLVGKVTDVNALKRLGEEGVLATVCDSTNALVPGESGSEARVREALTTLVGTLKGRVAVTAFASNVARLETVARAARQNNRRVALVGRAMHKITEAARKAGYLRDFPPLLSEEEAAELPSGRVLYLVTGSQGEPRAALARIADNNHPTVSLTKGDAVIFSSRVIPGNDLAIHELHNKLSLLGVEVLSADDHFVHVSGHPCRDELAEMYRWTRPQIAIPVHGEPRHMAEHARLARSLQVPQAIVPQNGQLIRLAPGRASVIDEVPSGRVHLDGRVMIEEGAGLGRHRRSLAFAGMIAITVVLDAKGRAAADPSIIIEGIPGPIHDAVRDALEEPLKRHNPKRDGDGHELKESLRRAARRAADAAWGKKPVTKVEIIQL
ncbi:MAG: ribonuclease J [Alphaproteobacteria bacterium]|nr:ribonuclease J [Alphaproteobacteria bacterium]MBL7096729.1 ribonuclease J [Alphaproteobacteria bacterium]